MSSLFGPCELALRLCATQDVLWCPRVHGLFPARVRRELFALLLVCRRLVPALPRDLRHLLCQHVASSRRSSEEDKDEISVHEKKDLLLYGRWVFSYLSQSYLIPFQGTLVSDWSDGVALCLLISSIKGGLLVEKRLKIWNGFILEPRNVFEKLQNCQVALTFLKRCKKRSGEGKKVFSELFFVGRVFRFHARPMILCSVASFPFWVAFGL